MPAQKLTPARLAQILIMLILLLIAFFWRTVTYEPSQSFQCQLETKCTINVNNHPFTAFWQSEGQIVISNLPKNWKIAEKDSLTITQPTEHTHVVALVIPDQLPEVEILSDEGSRYKLIFAK